MGKAGGDPTVAGSGWVVGRHGLGTRAHAGDEEHKGFSGPGRGGGKSVCRWGLGVRIRMRML